MAGRPAPTRRLSQRACSRVLVTGAYIIPALGASAPRAALYYSFVHAGLSLVYFIRRAHRASPHASLHVASASRRFYLFIHTRNLMVGVFLYGLCTGLSSPHGMAHASLARLLFMLSKILQSCRQRRRQCRTSRVSAHGAHREQRGGGGSVGDGFGAGWVACRGGWWPSLSWTDWGLVRPPYQPCSLTGGG